MDTELLALESIVGRVLVEPITAAVDVPSFDCSRMDGYAINLDCLQTNSPISTYTFELGDATHATAQKHLKLCAERAIPIMTGGMMPNDANAIILKEHATVKDNQLDVTELPKKGQYIRKKGSDLKYGQEVIKSNQRLTSAHIGLLASLGVPEVKVFKQPTVALMMTGDELVDPGKKCLPGQIYDANTSMLAVLLSSMGCVVSVLDTLIDCEDTVNKSLTHIKGQGYDLVISVGGVSMGDKDWIPTVLEQQGKILFHKLQIKPGFPMVFGRLGTALFYGLPGNPVSAYTTLCQYVFPVIQKLKKQQCHVMYWSAKLNHDLIKTHNRREFLRGFYSHDDEGQIHVSICGGQQSSRIESLAEANCFVVLDEVKYALKTGDTLKIQPFLQFSKLSQ